MKNLTAELLTLINWMITTYHTLSAADEYWFGFVVDHMTYVVPHMTFEALTAYLKPDYTSHKKGHKFILRVKATAEQCRELIPSAICLGAEGILTEKVKNAGDGLELVLSEKFGDGNWNKHDSTGFNLSGDIRIEGKEVQVKFNNATLTSEQYLRKLVG